VLPVNRLACTLAILTIAATSPAQPTASPAPTAGAAVPTVTAADAPPTPNRAATLSTLNQAIKRISADVAELRREAEQATGSDAAALNERRQRREDDLARLREQFDSIATGITTDTFDQNETPELDLGSELKDLLSPIVNELKRATTRPRELDRLARQIDELREKSQLADSAIHRIQELGKTGDKQLDQRLADTLERWQEQKDGVEAELQVAQQRRQRLLGERTSVYGTIENLTQVFFRSRGRNLLLACLAFVLAWLLVRGAHVVVRRYSPLHGETRQLAAHIIDLVFMLGAVLVGTLAALAVLYTVGDWVLLTIVSLFLVGMAWASRTALPRIWRQLVILMNLGGVREGERIMFNGVPYRIDRLGFYTYLRNPSLTGGLLRLPLTHIAELYTRPFGSDERWFPTNPEDWVLFADGKLGKVVRQSPDFVTMIALGGARTLVPSSDFVQQSPIVLSAGFRHSIVFGIDYQHQAIITTKIPETLATFIRTGLENDDYGGDLNSLKVEFAAAGASSLDIAILADFKGSAASKYFILQRLIQRLCVDACNENGWVIPFTQITLHMATPVEVEGVSQAN
jgi:hypothetical protein